MFYPPVITTDGPRNPEGQRPDHLASKSKPSWSPPLLLPLRAHSVLSSYLPNSQLLSPMAQMPSTKAHEVPVDLARSETVRGLLSGETNENYKQHLATS
jgi:hypothetical protein